MTKPNHQPKKPMVQASKRPERIQRKRTKGWRMPPNTIYVGRPTKWGNPFKIGSSLIASTNDGMIKLILETPIAVVSAYREYIFAEELEETELWHSLKKELKGKDLACWCPLKDRDGVTVPCHADVLLEIANA